MKKGTGINDNLNSSVFIGAKPNVTGFLFMLIFIGLNFSQSNAQRTVPIGTWTSYISHTHPKKIIRRGDEFIVSSNGGFYTYDLNTSVTKTYSKVDGLAGVSPTAIYYHEYSGKVFLGYEDGYLNYFKDPSDGFDVITDIERNDSYTTKRINEFQSRGQFLFIATEFGIVIFDTEKNETHATVAKVGNAPGGSPVRDIAIIEDTIYAAMANYGLYYAWAGESNLTIPAVWTRADGNRGLPTGRCHFVHNRENEVYAQVTDTIFRKKPGQNWIWAPFPPVELNFMDSNGGFLYMGWQNLLRVYNSDSTPSNYNILHTSKFKSAYLDTNAFYLGDTVNGLMKWDMENDTFEVLSAKGPYNNKVSEISLGPSEFFVAPDGRAGASAPAFNYDGFYRFTQSEGWNRYNNGDEFQSPVVWADFERTYYDWDKQEAYICSWHHGVIKVVGGVVTNEWLSSNSGLPGSYNAGLGDELRVTGIGKDSQGNIWVCTLLGDYALAVLTPDGTWHGVPVQNGGSPVQMLIDDWDNIWLIDVDNGMTVFNCNGTIDDFSDDQSKKLTTSTGNGGLPSNNVLSLAKDKKGRVWVGTVEGVAVFANPSSLFSNLSDASCPVIDGFCLLRDQRVTSIEVDGANRKWIGTSNGAYLVNAQGNRLITHYTIENSPLFSNYIVDIEIDPITGEIFFGTDRGLISLMGEATEGEEDSEGLYVFPNPIFTDYDGPISIANSVADAQVRITSVSGDLVRELTSTGGQTVWDGRDKAGNKLKPGIYMAIVSDKDGNGAGIAKFAVIERQQ